MIPSDTEPHPYPLRSRQQLLADAQAIWASGVRSVQGHRLIQNQLKLDRNTLILPDFDLELSLTDYRRIHVLGGGKAGRSMAVGLEQVLAPVAEQFGLTGSLNIPQDSLPVTPDRPLTPPQDVTAFGVEAPGMADLRCELQFDPRRNPTRWIELDQVRPAGENLATALAVRKTTEMLQAAQAQHEADLCIVLLSGGGSALLSAPLPGLDWRVKNQVTQFLAGRAASIGELNCVRTALSQIKGGGLLRHCRAGRVITLVISDVLGDPPETIASGPMTLPNSTVADQSRTAMDILARYDPDRSQIPAVVYQLLQQPDLRRSAARSSGQSPNQMKLPLHDYCVLGNLAVAIDAAGVEAEKRGYSHVMHIQKPQSASPTAAAEGEHLAELLTQMSSVPGPDCLITGGEPVVDLRTASADAKGGRNQELALAALARWQQGPCPAVDSVVIAGGTDGEDGPTIAAGGILGSWQVSEVSTQEAERALHAHDSHTCLANHGSLLVTGPTGTNVCDLRVNVVARIQPQPGRPAIQGPVD